MAVSFSSISGRAYPAWLRAFQASLEWSALHGSQLFKHLWKGPSCMAVSFSSISGKSYPPWQSAFQASMEKSILHGSQLFKHLWKSLSCMAVSFQASLEESILDGCELFKHLWKSLSCMAVSFSSISGCGVPIAPTRLLLACSPVPHQTITLGLRQDRQKAGAARGPTGCGIPIAPTKIVCWDLLPAPSSAFLGAAAWGHRGSTNIAPARMSRPRQGIAIRL